MRLQYPPEIKSEKEKLDYIVKNEQHIFDLAKTMYKEADSFGGSVLVMRDGIANKAFDTATLLQRDSIKARVAISSSNILDSHLDLHLPKMWDKSIKESGHRILHLSMHSRTFKDIIAKGDDLRVFTETVTWKQLGFNIEGSTELLSFDSNIKKSQNEEMFKEYAKGNVTEHSVGMMYVKMITCINDEDYPVQKENWDKYAPMVHNKEALKTTNVFWAQQEAKVIEGSAVPLGSNPFTPTQTIKNNVLGIEQAKAEALKQWLLG